MNCFRSIVKNFYEIYWNFKIGLTIMTIIWHPIVLFQLPIRSRFIYPNDTIHCNRCYLSVCYCGAFFLRFSSFFFLFSAIQNRFNGTLSNQENYNYSVFLLFCSQLKDLTAVIATVLKRPMPSLGWSLIFSLVNNNSKTYFFGAISCLNLVYCIEWFNKFELNLSLAFNFSYLKRTVVGSKFGTSNKINQQFIFLVSSFLLPFYILITMPSPKILSTE